MASCFKHPTCEGVLPCQLTRHTYWHAGRQRTSMGKELFRNQGFPKYCKVRNLTGSDLKLLSGSAICVRWILRYVHEPALCASS